MQLAIYQEVLYSGRRWKKQAQQLPEQLRT